MGFWLNLLSLTVNAFSIVSAAFSTLRCEIWKGLTRYLAVQLGDGQQHGAALKSLEDA